MPWIFKCKIFPLDNCSNLCSIVISLYGHLWNKWWWPIDYFDFSIINFTKCFLLSLQWKSNTNARKHPLFWKRLGNCMNIWLRLEMFQTFSFTFSILKDAEWFEISHSQIREMGREIGKGAFGRVFIARISDIPGKLSSQIVAIKKLKSKF